MDDRLNDPSFIISLGGISCTTTDRSGVVIITSAAVIMIAVCSSEGPLLQKSQKFLFSIPFCELPADMSFLLLFCCVCFLFIQCLHLLLVVVLVVATVVSMR